MYFDRDYIKSVDCFEHYRHFQFSSVAQSCPTLCDPMNHSMPGLPVHHQLPELTQTHVHRVSDAIQPYHPSSIGSKWASKSLQYTTLTKYGNHMITSVLYLLYEEAFDKIQHQCMIKKKKKTHQSFPHIWREHIST